MKLEITVKTYDHELCEHDAVIVAATDAEGQRALSARVEMDGLNRKPSWNTIHAVRALRTLANTIEQHFK